jgi:hypothetical protein
LETKQNNRIVRKKKKGGEGKGVGQRRGGDRKKGPEKELFSVE